MCGICAVICEDKENEKTAKDIFTRLLLSNESRGEDSTGVVAIGENIRQLKEVKTARELIHTPKYKELKAKTWIGHTRNATTGTVSRKNAHPLSYGDTLLVHNGILNNYEKIAKQNGQTYNVDSEVIIPAVNSENWKSLIKITGSMNFIAYNLKLKRIYIHRHGNPLYWVLIPSLGIYALSSTAEELEIASNMFENSEVMAYIEDRMEVLTPEGDSVDAKKLKYPKPKEKKKIGYYTGQKTHNHSSTDAFPDIYQNGDKTSKKPCKVCGVEITEDEELDGMTFAGKPLCIQCLEDTQVDQEWI